MMKAHRSIRFAVLIFPGFLAIYQTTWAFSFVDLVGYHPHIQYVTPYRNTKGLHMDREPGTIYVGCVYSKVTRRFIPKYAQVSKNILDAKVWQLDQASWQKIDISYRPPMHVAYEM